MVGRLNQNEVKFIRRFGFILRRLRLSKDWTLEEAEEQAVVSGWKSCSWQHLQAIEAGKKDVSLSTLLKLSKLYKVHIDNFFEN